MHTSPKWGIGNRKPCAARCYTYLMESAHRYILFIRPGCPYCGHVLHEAQALGVAFELKNVENPEVAQELKERGGKLQVPYLIDTGNGREMYESDDIISYLHETFTPDP